MAGWLLLAQATAQAEQPSTLQQARSHFEQGRAAYADGQLKRALVHFSRAYELAPSAELEFDLARVYERIGEPEPAIRHYLGYLRRSAPDAAERQQIETRIRELRSLQERMQAQLKAAPPTSAALTAEARAFFERGLKLFGQQRYEAALAAFAAARRFAALPELAYNMALSSERMGRIEEAVDHYRAYLREAKGAADAERVQARVKELLTDPRRSQAR